MFERIKELIETLNYNTKLYDEGHPTMTDEEWDKLYFELCGLELESGMYFGDSPTQKVNYQIVNELNKVKHNHPMLSLQKTQSIDDIVDFIGKKEPIIMLKIDGLTCSLTYENGQLIAAETRGDGEIGEDILHNALVVSNIPNKIPFKGRLVVDGEIICKYDAFTAYIEYKNPRNFASGSIRLLNSEECRTRHLSFIAWDLIEAEGLEFNKLNEKLLYLIDNYFEVVPFTTTKFFNEDLIEGLKNTASYRELPIDGLVIKYNDCEYYESLGRTDHHFRGGIAFKFYDETYETKLLNIEYTMGRTGVLTPVAIFEPVEIDGCEVSRASLHNLSIVEALFGTTCPEKNTVINVFKANQIIPQIKDVISVGDGLPIPVPEVCPVCGGIVKEETLIATTLVCTNPNCEGKIINILDHFCGKKGLDIKGLSKATLEKLMDWGWVKNYEDIFNLDEHKSEWMNKPGFGEKSVSNILNAIQESKNCKLDKFIAALGIPLIGSRAGKDLANYFGSWTEFIKAIDTKFKFYDLPNFGAEMHSAITEFDYTEAKILAEKYLNIMVDEAETANSTFEGKTFVVTGKLTKYKNRNEIKALIENLGGKVSDSISGKTSYLINNDVNSTSSKNLSAKKLNIPIISEEDFIALLG